MRCLLPVLALFCALLPAQESQAPFHAPLVVLPLDSPPFQRLLDYDGDGDLDAVGTRVRSGGNEYEVTVWRNDQGALSAVFTQRSVATVPLPPSGVRPENMHVAVGDWNADGLEDFVVAAGATSHLYLAGNGSSFRQMTISQSGTVTIEDVAMADFDGDGRDDVAVIESSLGVSSTLFLRLAAGGAPSSSLPFTPGSGLDLIQADGDPLPEIAVKRGARYEIFDLRGGQLVALATLDTTIAPVSTMPWLWMSGDLDGDGDDDVVVFQPALANNFQPLYQVFRRVGPSSWNAEQVAVGGPAEYLADVDGDGDLDGVCCGGGGGGSPSVYRTLAFPSTFEIARNEGGGVFRGADAFPGTGSRSLAGAADIDGDGDVDLVAGRCIFYGRGPWERHPMPPTGMNSLISRRYLLADGDRDGDPDFMHNPHGGNRNQGDGSFEMVRLPGVSPPAGRFFGGGFSADVDGDGANDQVVPMFVRGSTATFEYMVLIRNNGGGTYSYGGPVTAQGLRIGTGFTVDHFASADVDGDGDVDLIANANPNQNGYGSQVFWQQAGSFVAGPAFPGERIEAVHDFDGDGRPDLLLNRSGNLRIALAVDGPTTTFGPPHLLGVVMPFQPRALVVADLDDDGRLDVVVPSAPNPVLLLNRTTGPGTVSFASSVLTGIELSNDWPAIEAADFDGDGLCDIALSPLNGEPNVGLVLMRQGMAGAVPVLGDYRAVRMVLPSGFAADADGDGDLDLLGDNVAYSVQHIGPRAGRRVQVGDGVPGQAGVVPILGATGPFRIGSTERLMVRGLPGPTFGLLAMAARGARIPDFPLPGHTFLLDPASTLTFLFAVSGNGGGIAAASAVLTLPLPASIAGLSFHVQAFALDAAAAHGASCTNGVIKDIGW